MTVSKITDAELKKYYSDISKALVCSRKEKTAFITELKSNIDEYLAKEPDTAIENIMEEFGTPLEIANSFIDNAGANVIKKKIDIKKYILLALAVALIIYLIFVVVSLIDVHTEAHGYIDEGIMMISTLKGGADL